MVLTRHRVLAILFIVLHGPTARAFCLQPAEATTPALQPNVFEPLPLGSIKPAGWLKEQLRIQADGLSGHLDEFWPDIKESAWFGGTAEGWERVPYWLDGLVPLAFETNSPELKAKVKRAVDYILAHRQPDGWLGPVGDSQKHKPYDVWPLFPLFKALVQYQQATGDRRIIPALLGCCRKIDQVVSREPLYSWAKVRAADCALTLYWLYVQTGERWILDLAKRVLAQSEDWRALYENFPYAEKAGAKKNLENHGVNTAMGLKYGPVRYRLSGDVKDKTAIFPMLDILDHVHGQPTGIFTCDEHLAGRSPSQGTELCTVVEAMYSLEVAASITGDARLGDRLEMLAFNALPATFKKDMTAHQYDQQCNQVICTAAGEHVYVSNEADANLYGLEPNFGCCTANMHQGWPKFTSHLWMKSGDGGLAAIAYAPCVVETTIAGNSVRIEVSAESSYPFGDPRESRVVIKVRPALESRFPVHLRIPSWGGTASCNLMADGRTLERIQAAKSGSFLTVNREWSGHTTTEINLTVEMPMRLREGFNRAVSIQRGPVIYALQIMPEWRVVKDRPGLPFDDWEALPRTPWNYALDIDRSHPERSITFESRTPESGLFADGGAARRQSPWPAVA